MKIRTYPLRTVCVLAMTLGFMPALQAQTMPIPTPTPSSWDSTFASVTQPSSRDTAELDPFRFLPWKDYHVLHYPLPQHLKDWERDLPYLKSFLHLQALRLRVPSDAKGRERLQALIKAVDQAGFTVELLLSDGVRLESVVALLQHPAVTAVIQEVPTQISEDFRQDYEGLQQLRRPDFKVGLWFNRMPDVRRFLQVRKLFLLASPDFYAYHYQGPLYDMHTHVRRLQVYLDRPWQLAQLSLNQKVAAHYREHEAAWMYRLGYFFAKKYGLLPTVPHLYTARETQHSSSWTPGLLRSGERPRTPAYWLAHIYFHLNRIDIDEYKLARALYTPIAHREVPRSDTALFLQVYYKRRTDRTLPEFIARKRSDLFYDFVKRESEESLLHSHFARLETLRVNGRSPLSGLNFLSALGRFRFLQVMRYGEVSPFSIEGLQAPILASAFKVYQKEKTSELPPHLHWVEELPKRFVSGTQDLHFDSQLLRPLNTWSGAVEIKQPHHILLSARAKAAPAPAVDLQPLALVEDATGHVFIPDPLFFKFFKRVESGQEVKAIVPFPDSESAFSLRMGLEPARERAPRKLNARVQVLPGKQLRLEVYNPFVERLFLPGLVILAEQGAHVFSLEYVLPEGLLPLEQRTYRLQLPPQFEPDQPIQWHVRAAAYPVIDQAINLDDAFRSDIFGLKAQALTKYTEVFSRFAPKLSLQHRESVAQRILNLSAALETLPETEARLEELKAQGGPDFLMPPMYMALVRAYLKRGVNPLTLAMRPDFQAAFAENNWFPALEDYELWAYLQKEAGNLEQSISFYAQSLSLVLAQQNAREINHTFAILIDLYWANGEAMRAVDVLEEWRRQPAYQALDPATRARYLERLAYLSLQMGDQKRAVVYYREHIRQTHAIQSYAQLAALYRRQGQLDLAIETYRALLQHCAPCAQTPHLERLAYRELGFLLKSRDPRAAAAYYERYLARVPGDRAVQNTLVELYLAQGRYTQASAWNRRLLQQCQGQRCGQYWQRQGALEKRLGHRTAALDAYVQALQWQSSRGLWQEVAYLAQEQKRLPLAAKALERLLQQAPGSQAAKLRLDLAQVYRAQGKTAALRTLLQPFLSGAQPLPVTPQSDVQLAQLYQSLGQTQAAIHMLTRAITRPQRSSAVTPYHYRLLAALYRESGDLAQATMWLERLQAQFPRENTLAPFNEDLTVGPRSPRSQGRAAHPPQPRRPDGNGGAE